MSGAKRKTKYRKGVEAEILTELPEPQTANQFICRVLGSRGGNILEIETGEMAARRKVGENSQVELCRLPSRFRNVVWVKRGSFLICDQATEADFEGKVRFVCLHVLFTPDSIRNLKQKGLFPPEFDENKNQAKNDEMEDKEEEDFTPRNPNRALRQQDETSSSEDEE